MEIKTLWEILLKGLGIWLLIRLLEAFFQLFFIIHSGNDLDWILYGLTCIPHILIVAVLIFKTDYIIKILNLDKNPNQNKIDINISKQALFTISLITIGGITVVNNFVPLSLGVWQFLIDRQIFSMSSFSMIFQPLLKILIGLLLITNYKTIQKFVANKKNGL